MKCTVPNCKQDRYWKSNGLCYYHWKVQQKLIDEPSESENRDVENLFFRYYKQVDGWIRSKKLPFLDYIEYHDILQEAYVQLLFYLSQVDWSKSKAQIKSYLKSCVTGAVLNYCKVNDCLIKQPRTDEKQQNTIAIDSIMDYEDQIEVNYDIEEVLSENEDLRRLKDAINRLNKHLTKDERCVLRCHILAENPPTFRELAKLLNINHPQKALRLRLKILRKLRILYECMEEL